jgi:hypothetical protein
VRALAVFSMLAGCAPPMAPAPSQPAAPSVVRVAPAPPRPDAAAPAKAEEPAVDGRVYATQWRIYYYVNRVRVLREIKADTAIGHAITELGDDGCPLSMAALAKPKGLTVDAWNQPLILTCDPATTVVSIRSAGPDGRMDTADDLSSGRNIITEPSGKSRPEQLVDASCRYLERAGIDTIACGVAFNHPSTRQGIADCDDLIALLGSFPEHAGWTWEDRLYPKEFCRQGTIYIPELVCIHQFERVADAKLCSVEHAGHWNYFEKDPLARP